MEPVASPVTPVSVGVRYGLLTGLASIIFSFILLATDNSQSSLRWLGLVITIGGMVLAHNEFKKHNQGFMNYGQGLGIGTVMSAVGGVLNTVFSYVYMTFIEPGYMARIMEQTRAKMEENAGLSEEQIDQAMAMTEKFSGGGWLLVFGILGSVLFGFIIALLVSAITKNSRPEFD
ncbi:hypothetical protein GCM10023185_34130 [Hymenobacter saemangeumensis]|uniref:DUF4199 domain-containing protein n=1 Tax=Hymenobacter saemangeumensis TaxID=1084522 RepID=A0ABP8INR9_9BACT